MESRSDSNRNPIEIAAASGVATDTMIPTIVRSKTDRGPIENRPRVRLYSVSDQTRTDFWSDLSWFSTGLWLKMIEFRSPATWVGGAGESISRWQPVGVWPDVTFDHTLVGCRPKINVRCSLFSTVFVLGIVSANRNPANNRRQFSRTSCLARSRPVAGWIMGGADGAENKHERRLMEITRRACDARRVGRNYYSLLIWNLQMTQMIYIFYFKILV